MTLSLLASLALAGPQPETLDVSDPTPWEASWSVLQDGPPGCWEVVGAASWSWSFGRFGYAKGDAAFVGRFESGVWRDVVVRSMGEEEKWRRDPPRHIYDHDRVKWMPMVGRRNSPELDEDEDGLGDQVISWALRELGSEVEFADTRWDAERDAVILNRTIPFETAGKAVMEVTFPGGDVLPTGLTLDFPDSFTVPGFRLARVTDAKARIRARAVGGTVFPEAETMSFGVSVLGMSGEGAQTIRYRSFRPCGGATKDEAKAVGK